MAQVFSCEFCEISKNTSLTALTEHLWATAYINRLKCIWNKYRNNEIIRLDTYFLSSYHFCTIHHLQDQSKKEKTIPTESCFEVLRYIHMKAILKNKLSVNFFPLSVMIITYYLWTNCIMNNDRSSRCKCSMKKTVRSIFANLQESTCVFESLFTNVATVLKKDSSTGVFLSILEIFCNIFYKTHPDDCFWWLNPI